MREGLKISNHDFFIGGRGQPGSRITFQFLYFFPNGLKIISNFFHVFGREGEVPWSLANTTCVVADITWGMANIKGVTANISCSI